MRVFGRCHPFVLLVYFLSVLLVAMFVSNPILQAQALLGGIGFCLLLRRRSDRSRNAGFYLLLFFLITLTNPFFSHSGETTLLYVNRFPITLEALLYGAALAVMLIGVMLWCRCLSEVMSSDKLLYLFGRGLPKLSLILSMALRLIPLFKRQMQQISRAQKTMGQYPDGGKYTHRIKGAMRVFLATVSWSLESAMETAASMKARGYGLRGRTQFSLYRFRPGDAVLLTSCVLLLGVTLAGTASGDVAFYYYPHISGLMLTPHAVSVYAAYAALVFLPFFIEGKEALTWKYCVSKI